MGKYNINFEIDIPYKSEKSDIYMEKLKEILNKYIGQQNDNYLMLSIQYELENFYVFFFFIYLYIFIGFLLNTDFKNIGVLFFGVNNLIVLLFFY